MSRIDQIISQKGYNYSNIDLKLLHQELNIEEDEIKDLLTEMQAEMFYASVKERLIDGEYSGICENT